MLHRGKKVINIDESAFNSTSTKIFGWFKPGSYFRVKPHMRRFKTVTVISAVESDGRHWWCMLALWRRRLCGTRRCPFSGW